MKCCEELVAACRTRTFPAYPRRKNARSSRRLCGRSSKRSSRPRERRAEAEQALRQFTEEQYVALDGMARYERVVFEGPAGTGKTLLALEAARREAASGYRVGVICFNRLLGRWLHEQAAQLSGDVTASTLHQLMLRSAT